MGRNLESYEVPIQCVEVAYNHGFSIVANPNGGLALRPMKKDFDKESHEFLKKLLRPHKSALISLASDANALKQTLIEGQQALSEGNKEVNLLLDRFDRLEKVYRLLFPDVKECINSEKGCPVDAVVYCTACEGRFIEVRHVS